MASFPNLDWPGTRSPTGYRMSQSKVATRFYVRGSTDTAPFTTLPLPFGEPETGGPPSATAIPVEDFAAVRLMFGGAGADDTDFGYRVVLWYYVAQEGADNAYIPLVVAQGVATLGATRYTVAQLGAAGNKFADTITETSGRSGSIVTSLADGTTAWLEIDLRNAVGIQVDLDLDGGSAVAVGSMDVLMQFGEGIEAMQVEVQGIGLATAANQTTLLADTNALEGGDLTYSRVSIITAGAATTSLLAKTASQTQRLHGLRITVSAAALVEIEDKDGVVLATWNFGANGGIVIPFNREAEGAIQATAVNKGLQIVNSAGNLGGYAIVSTG